MAGSFGDVSLSTPKIYPKNCLPHTGPMLMLSEVVSHTAQAIACSAKIQPDNPLLQAGEFPAIGGVELFAQAAGVLFGIRNGSAEASPKAKSGAVIQLKSFTIGPTQVPVGETVDINADYIGGNDQAAMMQGTVKFKGLTLFKGSLMIALFTKEKS